VVENLMKRSCKRILRSLNVETGKKCGLWVSREFLEFAELGASFIACLKSVLNAL